MDRETRYVSLITSLPYHGPLFGARQTPLSRLRLDQRLKVLEEADARELAHLVAIVDWIHHSLERTDEELVRRTRALEVEASSEFLRELLRFRMEMRTLVAALRRRRRGEGPPPPERIWGYGRWVGHIARYWSEPGFRLERVFPWVSEAERLLREGDSVALERLQLGAVWEHLDRVSEGHYFDFEAVVIYVLRWDLIARWTRHDGETAAQRFDALVEAGLGAHASVFGDALPSMAPPDAASGLEVGGFELGGEAGAHA